MAKFMASRSKLDNTDGGWMCAGWRGRNGLVLGLKIPDAFVGSLKFSFQIVVCLEDGG